MPAFTRTSSPALAKPFGGYITLSDLSAGSSLRKHFTAAAGEFVGTFLFLLTAYLGHATSVQNAPVGDASPSGSNSAQTIIFISLSYGFSLLVAAWVLCKVERYELPDVSDRC